MSCQIGTRQLDVFHHSSVREVVQLLSDFRSIDAADNVLDTSQIRLRNSFCHAFNIRVSILSQSDFPIHQEFGLRVAEAPVARSHTFTGADSLHVTLTTNLCPIGRASRSGPCFA